MAKELKINIWERTTLLLVLNARSGRLNLGQLSRSVKLQDILEFTEQEVEETGWKELRPGAVQWNPNAANTIYTLEFSQRLWKELQQAVKAYQGWELDNRGLILLEKMGIELPEED